MTEKLWRHKLTGRTYAEVGRASMQNSGNTPLPDYTVLVVYRAGDGTLWCRPEAEFGDGRFERVS